VVEAVLTEVYRLSFVAAVIFKPLTLTFV